jgi:hypothetical protein
VPIAQLAPFLRTLSGMMSQPVMEILFSIAVLALPAGVAAGMVLMLGKGIASSLARKSSAPRKSTPQVLREQQQGT